MVNVRRDKGMKNTILIGLFLVAAGCLRSPTAGERVPTVQEIEAALPPTTMKREITEIRKAQNGNFTILFSSTNMEPQRFEDGRIIPPPVTAKWTNDHWEIQSMNLH